MQDQRSTGGERHDIGAPEVYRIRHLLMDANFHGLLNVKLTLINKDITNFLISCYRSLHQDFKFPNRATMDIRPSNVGRVYGLMYYGEPVDAVSDSSLNVGNSLSRNMG